jgi:phosphoserine phosphatase RsbX
MGSRTTAIELDWAVAARPLPGEVESGDGHVVRSFPGGTLVAVFDALGHGEEAATVSRIAAEVIRKHAERSVDELFAVCHERLRRTRGTVMTIASIRDPGPHMTWAGVGNVEAMLMRALPRDGGASREPVPLRGGVVGYRIPATRTDLVAVAPGDVLILATDGIQSIFGDPLPLHDSPAQIADALLHRFARPNDDALVLVARLGGEPS